MARGVKGAETRERVLEIAQGSVLAKGFAATSIEEIIAEAGITKSGFFYHFKDKNELAHEMLARYVEADARLLDDIFRRADELADDPLQAFLVALKLLAEAMDDLEGGHPGCLVASVCYQERLFDRKVIEMNRVAVANMNAVFRARLDAIVRLHAPREPVDIEALSEMICCAIDGAIIQAKVRNDNSVLSRQVLAYRAFIKALFSPVGAASLPLQRAA
ncbi:MAG TPA: TetR/AcrR family transcriptional regulator [Rhizobiaceae bacterium]|nr:TetR/AcrR family transcriptional regulator [Rhizobiaceae bacterium]